MVERKITLLFKIKDDGFMYISSLDVPGLFLASPKEQRADLFSDLGPTLRLILSANQRWPEDDTKFHDETAERTKPNDEDA